MKLRAHSRRGISVLEVLLVLATTALVLAIFLPGLARARTNNRRNYCGSNLKQIGISYRLYAQDHEGRFPFAVSNSAGGTYEDLNSSNVHLHYATMSNELVSPKLLVCPRDKERRVVEPTPVTYFNNFQGVRNNNISYLVGLDADGSKPERLLSGDRNITGGTLSNGFLRLLNTNTSAGWTREIHSGAGNIGLADGSVMQTTPETLRKQLERQTLPVIRLAIP